MANLAHLIEPGAVPDDPLALLADARARLAVAAADRRAAMHAPVVVTADADARIMVLRAADADLAALRFHTDARAPKVATIAANPRLSILAYDPAARVQLRMTGKAHVEATGALADAAWAAASPLSRRCYLAEAGPSAAMDRPGSALPPHLVGQRPSLAESEAGRGVFAVIVVRVETLDWLRLDSTGGLRARFARSGEGWTGEWIAP